MRHSLKSLARKYSTSSLNLMLSNTMRSTGDAIFRAVRIQTILSIERTASLNAFNTARSSVPKSSRHSERHNFPAVQCLYRYLDDRYCATVDFPAPDLP